MSILVYRLNVSDADTAAAVTRVMAETFEEGQGSSTSRLITLLQDERFWLYGAFEDGLPIGGLTAHVIPLTREDGQELFIYDIAVKPSHQRRGIGTKLMGVTLDAAWERGLLCAFVPADNEDLHALDFYQAISGKAQPVTFYNFNP